MARYRYAKGKLDAPEAETAVSLIAKSRELLDVFARAALARGCTGETTLLVLIDVDSDWRWLADELMPDTDWQPLRERAALTDGKVMACGTQPRERVTAPLLSRGIDIDPAFSDPAPAPGEFWVVVCFKGGLGMGKVPAPGASFARVARRPN